MISSLHQLLPVFMWTQDEIPPSTSSHLPAPQVKNVLSCSKVVSLHVALNRHYNVSQHEFAALPGPLNMLLPPEWTQEDEPFFFNMSVRYCTNLGCSPFTQPLLLEWKRKDWGREKCLCACVCARMWVCLNSHVGQAYVNYNSLHTFHLENIGEWRSIFAPGAVSHIVHLAMSHMCPRLCIIHFHTVCILFSTAAAESLPPPSDTVGGMYVCMYTKEVAV